MELCIHRIDLNTCKKCSPTGSIDPPPLKITFLEREMTPISTEHYEVGIGLLKVKLFLFSFPRSAALGYPVTWEASILYGTTLRNEKAESIEEALKAAALYVKDKLDPFQKCNGCNSPILAENIYADDGCPCNSRRGVNVKPKTCEICRTKYNDNCVKPGHHFYKIG